MKRLLAAAAVLATLTHAAFAGELTLFADSDFRGARVTLQARRARPAPVDFNDRVSSVVVRSGIWELCQDANFGGRCAQFGPGEYRALPGFNDAISSVREIARGGRAAGATATATAGATTGATTPRRLRDGGDVARAAAPGRCCSPARASRARKSRWRSDVRSLNDVGFNDRAVSLIIREGRWEFCEHGDFRGQCVVYGPGRYPFLEGMNNRISSMRRVR